MATAVATLNNGFEWRTLLGNTHQWKLPPLQLDSQPADSIEKCALCGEPIGDKAFATNSAGEFPTHLTCSSGDEPISIGLQPVRKTLRRFLRSLVTG
jgi:hypothetical protein